MRGSSRAPLALWLLVALAWRAPALPAGDAVDARPGNVFLQGEAVVARFPDPIPAAAVAWRALDDRRHTALQGDVPPPGAEEARLLRVGALGIGWYRLELVDRGGALVAATTAAVLSRMESPPPDDSPVAVDSASAWFARSDAEGQRDLARLASLAGVRWVRDRLRWRDIEPSAGAFAEPATTYDLSAEIQAKEGLRVLQVFHDTPAWAVDPALDGDRGRGRFARDLRIVHRLAREMARRFRGRVQAWEPWNEANVRDFGGHTIDEMCSWQKAAWLGFKAGAPETVVGWNAYTGSPTRLHAEGIVANEAWPYFDTYNIHSYDWPDSYEELWAPAREAACGKPLWVTEADRGIRYTGEKPWCELSPDDEIRKAEYMAQAYASSLAAGASRHFHFILGHYTEEPSMVQFGLLRLDRTPRPAYVALAAIGRLLAGGRWIGRWVLPDRPEARIHAFRARPGGVERDVLVAWAESPGEWSDRGKADFPWSLPEGVEPESCHDYLGRPLEPKRIERLRSAATFIVLPAGSADRLPLAPARPAAGGTPPLGASPIVLQLQLPSSLVRKEAGGPWSHGFEYAVPAGETATLEIFAYNFSPDRVAGEVRLEGAPPGARIEPSRWDVAVEPMERTRITAAYTAPGAAPDTGAGGWIRLRGEFGAAGRPALAFRRIGR